MRTFNLVRHEDVTGVSGPGLVAEGVQFFDGSCAMKWCVPGKPTSITFYQSALDVIHIHGHDGKTEVVWDERIESKGHPRRISRS